MLEIKQTNWFYLSYASGFPEKICYAMSQNINGPWVYNGILNEIAGNVQSGQLNVKIQIDESN